MVVQKAAATNSGFNIVERLAGWLPKTMKLVKTFLDGASMFNNSEES